MLSTKIDHRQRAKAAINRARTDLGLDAIGFREWLPVVSPDWMWNLKHQVYLYKKLEAVTAGTCKRLMIFMPPRHFKSETVTVRYSAWRLEREPKLNIILGCYNQKLANRFSRKIKRIVSSRVPLAPDRKAVEEWETRDGGGLRSVGVGAGITGFGAGLIVIDDPVKSRAEAESEVYRDNCWDWFKDDIYTRLEPDAAIVLTQTRWHDDDLAGRLLKEMEDEGGEQWEVVRLPAFAEEGDNNTRWASESEPGTIVTGYTAADSIAVAKTTSSNQKSKIKNPKSVEVTGYAAGHSIVVPETTSSNPKSKIENLKSADPLNRQPGEPLCPERYNTQALRRIQKRLGSYSFSALYQQNPVPAEGGLFKRAWFGSEKIVSKAPDGMRWVRGYDLAVSTRTSADYTASFRCAFDTQGNLYISDGFRARIEYPEQRRYVVKCMLDEKNTTHGIEKALHGQAFVQDLRRMPEIRKVPFRAVRVDSDKYTRALAWANLAEEGKVYFVRGPWIETFLDEICRFTGKGDTHDDQVDAVSLAVGELSRKTGKLHTFS